jgi:hypothetical protein
MSSTYSPLLRVELMAIGEKTNTWGPIANRNFGSLLEQAVAGAATINVTAADVVLTTQDGQSDQARCMILLVSGTAGLSRNITAPSISKIYAVVNGSNNSVVVKGAATTGVSIVTGDLAWVVWNGSDFVRLTSSPTAPTFSGRVTATGGVVLGSGAYEAGYLKLPLDAAGASITTAQRGMCVQATTTIAIPNATFAAGDAVTIFNTTASPITLTATVTTLRLAGTTSTGNRTLAGYGVCTVLFISGTLAVISGSGVT